MAEPSVLPLEGYRVVDFGWVYAGPLLTRLLADLGAEVIKVETRNRIDELRLSPENPEKDIESDPMFHAINRNKLSITVDFTQARGVKLLKELIAGADIVSENYRPGVLQRHGLGYPILREQNDRLVMISLSAAGQSGPWNEIRTYGPSISGLSGQDAMVGYPGEDVLGSQGFYPDVVAAVHGAYLVLAALWEREQTGQGQYIDFSQWEASSACLGEAFLMYQMNGEVPGTLGNRDSILVPSGMYPCEGEDEWIAIAVKTDREWRGLCEGLDQPKYARDPRFGDRYRRRENQDRLDQLLAEWTRSFSSRELSEKLQDRGVAATPVMHIDERLEHPHFKARNAHEKAEHPRTGMDWIEATPWKFSRFSCDTRSPAPLLGEHNEYVFQDILGYSDESVSQLKEQKVIH